MATARKKTITTKKLKDEKIDKSGGVVTRSTKSPDEDSAAEMKLKQIQYKKREAKEKANAERKMIADILIMVEQKKIAEEKVKEDEIELESALATATLPDDVQRMKDSGISNLVILTNILELKGKTYSDFIISNRDFLAAGFLTLVTKANQF